MRSTEQQAVSIGADAPRFVVTGVARSGTLFTARALAALGHSCGHEIVFTPSTEAFPGFGTAQGDVSWLAAPFLDALPAGTIVVHQTRDPLAVVRSLVGQRFLATRPHPLIDLQYRAQRWHVRVARPITNPRFVRFAARHCPAVFDDADEIDRCARYWVEWNRMIEGAAGRPGLDYARLRVEDLDVSGIRSLSSLLGGQPSDRRVRDVRDALGDATHRGRRTPPVTLDDIRDGDLRAAVVDVARRFGYDLTSVAPADV